MESPLVTVICLCYNQGRFVRDAIRSVHEQTYPNIELIVVDDASTDDSVAAIRACLQNIPGAMFFPLSKNVGNCKAFNHGLSHAKGEYIIDLAADDILLPDRIREGVDALRSTGEAYGVNFTDAYLTDEAGRRLRLHSEQFPHDAIPQGDVYRDIVDRFFILSPTMMFRADLLKGLGGYDERLAYEDFDIQVRSSRNFLYCYTPRPLVEKRIVRRSMSQRQFSFLNAQLPSTFRICEKIMALNRTEAERQTLSKRLFYEMRQALRLLHIPLFFRYVALWMRNQTLRY